MLLKNEDASLRLEFVNYEFPEAGAGTDEYRPELAVAAVYLGG